MEPTKAWTRLFEIYTDGDNVWAMRDGKLLGSKPIGQDIDGRDAALQYATIELVRDLAADSLDPAALA